MQPTGTDDGEEGVFRLFLQQLCRAADERLRMGLNSVIELGTPPSAVAVSQAPPQAVVTPAKPKDPPLVAAFRKIANGATEMPFAEVVKLLREIQGFEMIASLETPPQPRRAATTWPTPARSSAEGAAR